MQTQTQPACSCTGPASKCQAQLQREDKVLRKEGGRETEGEGKRERLDKVQVDYFLHC